jgi:hypothetical protein
MTHLKRRKRHDKEVARLENMMDNLEEVAQRLESTAGNESYIKQLSVGVAALKRMREAGLSAEIVEQVTQEAAESIMEQDQIDDAIGRSVGGAVDEDELNGELDDIMAGVMTEGAVGVGVPDEAVGAAGVAGGAGVAPLPDLPALPAHQPAVAQPAAGRRVAVPAGGMDAELAELAAGIPGL